MPASPKLIAPNPERVGGEPIFAAPWEARAFAMVLAMSRDSRFQWEDFRQRLIAEIGSADSTGRDQRYYERWLTAFERLLSETKLLDRSDIDRKAAELAAAPPPKPGDNDYDDHHH